MNGNTTATCSLRRSLKKYLVPTLAASILLALFASQFNLLSLSILRGEGPDGRSRFVGVRSRPQLHRPELEGLRHRSAAPNQNQQAQGVRESIEERRKRMLERREQRRAEHQNRSQHFGHGEQAQGASPNEVPEHGARFPVRTQRPRPERPTRDRVVGRLDRPTPPSRGQGRISTRQTPLLSQGDVVQQPDAVGETKQGAGKGVHIDIKDEGDRGSKPGSSPSTVDRSSATGKDRSRAEAATTEPANPNSVIIASGKEHDETTATTLPSYPGVPFIMPQPQQVQLSPVGDSNRELQKSNGVLRLQSMDSAAKSILNSFFDLDDTSETNPSPGTSAGNSAAEALVKDWISFHPTLFASLQVKACLPGEVCNVQVRTVASTVKAQEGKNETNSDGAWSREGYSIRIDKKWIVVTLARDAAEGGDGKDEEGTAFATGDLPIQPHAGLRHALHSLLQWSVTSSTPNSSFWNETATSNSTAVEDPLTTNAAVPALVSATWGLLASGLIFDRAPRAKWRGLHLDSARHFFEVSTVKKLLTRMSRLKLNVLHWHLTDDQGWRVESLLIPELHRIGGRRGPSLNGVKRVKHNGSAYPEPKYYSQSELKDIISYARARGVHIIPEIDLPAHAAAIIAALEYSGNSSLKSFGYLAKEGEGNDDCRPMKILSSEVGAPNCMGGTFGVMYPGPRSFAILRMILAEVCSVFQESPLFHIGGDQADYLRGRAWTVENAKLLSQQNGKGLHRAEGGDDEKLVKSVLDGKKQNLKNGADQEEDVDEEAAVKSAGTSGGGGGFYPEVMKELQAGGSLGRAQGFLTSKIIRDIIRDPTICPYRPEGGRRTSRDTPPSTQASEEGGKRELAVADGASTPLKTKEAIVWDESFIELDPNYYPPDNTRVMVWRYEDLEPFADKYRRGQQQKVPTKDGDEKGAKQKKLQVIFTPKQRLYFDYIQYYPYNRNRYQDQQRPASTFNFKSISLRRTFMTHRVSNVWDSEIIDIAGVQGCIWSELITTEERLWYQLVPRIYALADVAWTDRRILAMGVPGSSGFTADPEALEPRRPQKGSVAKPQGPGGIALIDEGPVEKRNAKPVVISFKAQYEEFRRQARRMVELDPRG
jgi:hypothetical protein